jgi:hypothetical protein
MYLKGLIIIIFFQVAASCTSPKNKDSNTPATWKEINETREQFWFAARSGQIDRMLSFHLDSPEYSAYDADNSLDRKTQVKLHDYMKAQGTSSINFNVEVIDSILFSSESAMETWEGTADISYHSGKKDTFEKFIVTVLYQKTDDGWKFRNLHSSSQLKELNETQCQSFFNLGQDVSNPNPTK